MPSRADSFEVLREPVAKDRVVEGGDVGPEEARGVNARDEEKLAKRALRDRDVSHPFRRR